MNRLLPCALAAASLAALAACGPVSAPASTSPPATASVPASSPAPASPAGDASPAASAKACAGLDAWQKQHGNSAAPPQSVSEDLMDAPDPLSGDFIAWDLAVSTSQPDAEADLLKVWTDCAKAEAAALGG